ncbi:MAG: hypothetical protein ACLRWQ_03010 [Flavonifractor plautii]
MGLAIAKCITAEHHGRIWAESKVDITTFLSNCLLNDRVHQSTCTKSKQRYAPWNNRIVTTATWENGALVRCTLPDTWGTKHSTNALTVFRPAV